MKFARRMRHSVLSPSVALAGRVRALRESGADVIDFGSRPDVPEHVKRAAVACLDSGASPAYTDVRGLADLRHAIAEKLARENALEVDAGPRGHRHRRRQAGGVCGGDGIGPIMATRCWSKTRAGASFASIVNLAGATPVPVPLREENRFVLDADDLRERIHPGHPRRACCATLTIRPEACTTSAAWRRLRRWRGSTIWRWSRTSPYEAPGL